MCVVAAKPFVLCALFSLRNPCWDVAGMGAGSPEHARCCQWDGKVPPRSRNAEMIGMVGAAPAFPEHWATGLRIPGFKRSLPNFRLLSNYG